MKKLSPEKLHALGVLCALAAIFIAVVLMFSGRSIMPHGWPASAQDAQKPWALELP